MAGLPTWTESCILMPGKYVIPGTRAQTNLVQAAGQLRHAANPKGDFMKIGKTLHFGAAAIAIAAFLTSCQSTPQGSGSVGANDLGGVVTGPSGPEAGVWVIAETTDLSTKFAKLV
ncbi:MAG: hypothetical protein E6H49_17225, partial [Betaproteobacteria bacterium]